MGFMIKVARIPGTLTLVYAFFVLFFNSSYSSGAVDVHRSMLVEGENSNPQNDPDRPIIDGSMAEYEDLTPLYGGGFWKRSMMTAAAGPHLYHPTKRVKVPKLGKRSWSSPQSKEEDDDGDDDGLYANYIYRHPLLFKMYTRKFN